jgi:pilus assembly protein CpaE
MDLDLDAGMVGFITKTKAVYSILDAVNNLHRLDISYWKALVSNGIPGVEIVASPLSLASKEPKDEQVRQVLAFARPHYDWTLTDLGRSLNHLSMSALDEIDEVCLVTTLEVPALHQSKQIVQTLLDSGYGKGRIRLILNRSPKRLDITPAELEKMLGLPIFCMVPNDYPELYETYAEGRMLSRNSELGKQIAKVAQKLSGLEDQNPSKKRFGIFGV